MAATTASTPAPATNPSRIPLIVMLLAVCLLAGAWYAKKTAAGIVGPLAIAASDNAVAVLAPGTLYRLDAEGALQSVDTETVASGIRDGGLYWAGETLLVSPGSDDELLRCSADGCAPFSDDNWAPQGAVQTHFDGNWFWFSETAADRVQRYNTDGKRIDMPVSDLSSPGSLWVQDDVLFVANAGERKIVSYKLHKRGIDEAETFAIWSEGPRSNPIDVPRRFLPDRTGGFKAIFANARGTVGRVVDIDADGEVTPVELEDLVHPVSLAWLGDALLVLDEENMQVLRVAADGSTSVFGDEDFQAQLAEPKSLRYWLRMLTPVLLALGVLGLGAGCSWLLHVLTWRPIDPALDVKPDSEGILWLPAECDLAPRRMPRYVLVALPIALLPSAALLAETPWLLPAVAWAALFLGAAILLPLIAASRANLPKGERIGLRDRQLIVTHPEHGRREFALPRVEWNETLLRPEAGLDIPLVRGRVALYHASTVENVLLPRLNLMRKLES